MASPTQCTCVWVDSGSWWWIRRPGMLWFMGSQRVGHDWATELNLTESLIKLPKGNSSGSDRSFQSLLYTSWHHHNPVIKNNRLLNVRHRDMYFTYIFCHLTLIINLWGFPKENEEDGTENFWHYIPVHVAHNSTFRKGTQVLLDFNIDTNDLVHIELEGRKEKTAFKTFSPHSHAAHKHRTKIYIPEPTPIMTLITSCCVQPGTCFLLCSLKAFHSIMQYISKGSHLL